MKHSDARYAALELSTQLLITAAQARGIAVELLDERSNLVRLVGGGRTEYVMQATRTSADSYIAPLLMNDKQITKRLLREAGIRVPAGDVWYDNPPGEQERSRYGAGSWIIKPNSTNFGIGISRIEPGATDSELAAAFELAFRYDTQVLAEECIPGKEYRFLVIDGVVRAVLHRVPAHVAGDGISTVRQLVAEKNTDPRRGSGYRTPLEKLQLGSVETAVLAESGHDFDSVPAAGHTVYLRKNSNISTGGDGIDVTGELHPEYQAIAVRSAQALGARICGVDIILENEAVAPAADPDMPGYAVIELNFNPALHIHDYPTVGINRGVENYVLDMLMGQ